MYNKFYINNSFSNSNLTQNKNLKNLIMSTRKRIKSVTVDEILSEIK